MRKKVFLSVILVIQFLIVTPSIAEPESLHNNQTCCEAGADIHGSVATGPWMSYPATRDDLYGDDDGQCGNLTSREPIRLYFRSFRMTHKRQFVK